MTTRSYLQETATIRRSTLEDLSKLRTWFNSAQEVMMWAGPTAHYPLNDDQLYQMMQINRQGEGTRELWSMVNPTDAALIGHFQLVHDDRSETTRLCRVGISPGYRGCGLGGLMIRRAVERAFAIPHTYRVELAVYSTNHYAIRCYRKAGFTAEGVRRKCVEVNGKRWDSVQMSILLPEWKRSIGAET
jgi:RimJ/RimL family protein N-acetyltransferase